MKSKNPTLRDQILETYFFKTDYFAHYQMMEKITMSNELIKMPNPSQESNLRPLGLEASMLIIIPVD